MAVYDVIKINKAYYIQSLSICFNPILCFGLKYNTRKQAVNAACDMSGFCHNRKIEREAYIDYLAEYKARIAKENNK